MEEAREVTSQQTHSFSPSHNHAPSPLVLCYRLCPLPPLFSYVLLQNGVYTIGMRETGGKESLGYGYARFFSVMNFHPFQGTTAFLSMYGMNKHDAASARCTHFPLKNSTSPSPLWLVLPSLLPHANIHRAKRQWYLAIHHRKRYTKTTPHDMHRGIIPFPPSHLFEAKLTWKKCSAEFQTKFPDDYVLPMDAPPVLFFGAHTAHTHTFTEVGEPHSHYHYC